ncbi:MAG: DUF1592 domain-containing protein [Acidobacteriota bacterium]|nr:DUF1592 domain-containing protein [Acidobacteriota bacterium]
MLTARLAGSPVARVVAHSALVVVALLTTGLAASTSQPTEAETSGAMRRLTEAQYRNAIADIFGPDIQFVGRMDPLVRPAHGLQAAGASRISVSAAGLEQYVRMARAIASQVVDEQHRGTFIACPPGVVDSVDDACATEFFHRVGRLLFRRPLSAEDVGALVAASSEGARLTGSGRTGLALALETMLVSPRFLFDIDVTETDAAVPGTRRLDPYSKASRLSFFLWNTTPDRELLDAAARGDLDTEQGLATQVDRLLAAPRVENAVRTFFSDMLGFERIGDLAKDAEIYPQFTRAVKTDMPEQTLRTIVDLLLTENGDYRDLLTTRRTFMTRALGVVYRLPVSEGDEWIPYEFPEDSQRAGILTQMNFLAAFSHDGRSSPTLRGKAIRELLLCQPVPDPPANVNFSLLEDTTNAERPTARDRLTPHRNSRSCAGCHRIMDPIGLSLENFDGVGAYRTEENGAPIDASGELDGVLFDDPMALGRAVGTHPALPGCLVNRLSEYAVRRSLTSEDMGWVTDLTGTFTASEYRLRELLRAIATSDAFYKPVFNNEDGEGVQP